MLRKTDSSVKTGRSRSCSFFLLELRNAEAASGGLQFRLCTVERG